MITDVDNTLFDWFHVWHATFRAMLDQIIAISGFSEAELLPEIRKIHQQHGTSEYAFLIEAMPSLRRRFPHDNLLEVFKPAIEAFRFVRRRELKLYDGVADTLRKLKEQGVLIVAYTESQSFYTSYRFRKLNLDGLVDYLYSPPDHDFPEGQSLLSIRSKPASEYSLSHTVHRNTPKDELKPNPELLLDIIETLGARKQDVLYVGDSRVKDVAMAQDAGVSDVLAEYGSSHLKEEYQLLVNVTHWTDEDVQREKLIGDREVSPTHTLKNSYSELLQLFQFEEFRMNK
ncbi:HAD family hydrolase [Ruegeria sp. AD91A]|uniref:HAD family hydrolase n=1 Tax=Ruegeria sp. AD91A TaxID=2293862 RepID=UPI001966E977|nr:HAD-IA family hydrolase [Ruegeria sp. AD91A]